MKTEARKLWSTSACIYHHRSTSYVTWFPASFLREPAFSLVFLLSVIDFPVALDVPTQILIYQDFSFPNLISDSSDNFCFPPRLLVPVSTLNRLPFVFEFTKQQSVHPCRPLSDFAQPFLCWDALLLSLEDAIPEY